MHVSRKKATKARMESLKLRSFGALRGNCEPEADYKFRPLIGHPIQGYLQARCQTSSQRQHQRSAGHDQAGQDQSCA